MVPLINDGQMLGMLALPGARPSYVLDALVELCNHLTTPLPARSGVVAGDWNVRGGPSLAEGVVGELHTGERVQVWGSVTQADGQWLLVRTVSGGLAGWLFHTALDEA
jgi:uncharacterized protein YraI